MKPAAWQARNVDWLHFLLASVSPSLLVHVARLQHNLSNSVAPKLSGLMVREERPGGPPIKAPVKRPQLLPCDYYVTIF